MTFRFIYSQEVPRLVTAVIIDSKSLIPEIALGIGSVIKTYTDGQIAQLNENSTLTYKIESMDGNLAGYFSILLTNMGQNATKFQQVLRPAFQSFSSKLSEDISNFIQNGEYRPDFLPT